MGCRIGVPVGIYGEIIVCLCRLPRSRTGSRSGGKRALGHVESGYLDWALSKFSGYLAADEVYDGPFCILSLVDNHSFRRLLYEVLDHAPAQADVIAFFQRAKTHLDARGLTVLGITTDGSKLYPTAIDTVFGVGVVPHQVCEFHVLKDITKAVLRALAKERKALTAKLPKLPRGRPSPSQRALVRKVKRQADKIADLFTHRYLFVKRVLTLAEQHTFLRITRGRKHLRAMREIMDQVYRLFDRRCRIETAQAKLAVLRRHIRRFKLLSKTLKPLFSSNLEKALTFLDDKLLPATSNAVERGNRRFRKMQASVYSVRTRDSIDARIALDLLRDKHSPTRSCSSASLHLHRAVARAASS